MRYALVTVCFMTGCALVAGVDEDYYLRGDGGSAGGEAVGGNTTATASGGNSASGGSGGDGGSAAGAGGIGGMSAGGAGGEGGQGGQALFPPGELGGPCMNNADCSVGECCADDACTDTCMIPCGSVSDCPTPSTMACEHGYCLFACMVDVDCLQPSFVCHHGCTACEKKVSQGCQ